MSFPLLTQSQYFFTLAELIIPYFTTSSEVKMYMFAYIDMYVCTYIYSDCIVSCLHVDHPLIDCELFK